MSPVRYRVVDGVDGADRKYGASEFLLLAAQLRRVPEHMRRTLTRRLRPIGQRAVDRARMNASWSKRIPAAISLRVSTTGRGAGLSLVVDHDVAPHARPYEGLLSRVFRHPLFGDRDLWFPQDARPFVWPAVLSTQQDIAAEVDAAIAETFAAADFD